MGSIERRCIHASHWTNCVIAMQKRRNKYFYSVYELSVEAEMGSRCCFALAGRHRVSRVK
jgi:hypothetical protein